MLDEKPSQIGRYKILNEIGRGGFGRVYRGYDPTVRRPVAVKVLTDVGKDVLTRFRNEAMVAGNLRHENIVTVYEFGTQGDVPFIAMEYLQGEDLQHIIASRKPLTLLEKCNIMWQVAEGLYCAHKNGVVHRDVKPANIMVLADGTVKIMDFGIARLTQKSETTRLTRKGFLIGTLSYMAPEQFTGSDFDDLCDIFAYGVIFYELATGTHPFEAPDAASLMYRLATHEPLPIRESVPDFPFALDQIITKAIHKERELRYHSLKEFQFDIEPIRSELQRERASQLLVQAQELFRTRQFEAARKLVQEVLSLEPSNTAARTLRENLREVIQRNALQPRIEALRIAGEEHLSARRFADAIQSFGSALRLDPSNVSVQARIENVQGLMEQTAKAAQLLVDARREFEQKNLTVAHRMVFDALSQDPRNTEAAALLQTLHDALELRQAEQRIDDALQKAQQLILISAYRDAIGLLRALGPDAESPKVKPLLEWLHAENAAQERKEKLHRSIAAVKDLLRDRKLDDATKSLAALQSEFPGNQEISNLLSYAENELVAFKRSKDIESVAADVTALTGSANFENALGVLDEALKKYPAESGLVRLLDSTMAAKTAWQRQQAIQSAAEQCERLERQDQFDAAMKALGKALTDFPDATVLLNIRSRLELKQNDRMRVERRARDVQYLRDLNSAAFMTSGFSEVVGQLASARDIVSRYLDDQEIQVTGGEVIRHLADIELAEHEVKRGNHVAALEICERHLRKHPNHFLFAGLKQRGERGQAEKRSRARALLAQAQAASAENRHDERRARLREAFGLDESDPAFRQFVLNGMVEYARSAVESDWANAEAWINEAASLQPGFEAPRDVAHAISERKRGALVGECLARVDEYRRAAKTRAALAEVERVLRCYPGELRLETMRGALTADILRDREQLAAELRSIGQAAQGSRHAREIEVLRNRALDLAAGNQGDAEASALIAAAVRNLELRARQIRWARWREFPIANRKMILVVTGAATLLVGAIAVIPRVSREHGNVSVAAKHGYKPITPPVQALLRETASKPTPPVAALPQVLQVNTNFESGRVYLDGRSAGELRDGQYSASDIAPGRHTIRVTGGGSDFQAEWSSVAGKPPELSRVIVARDVAATVVATAGATGSVICNCGAHRMEIDGASVDRSASSSGAAFALNGLKEGPHRVQIDERSFVVDVHANPVLNVVLSLDRNVGTLIVETGEDKVKVFLNNRIYPRTTEHGMLRIPIAVGEYSIRVEKESFQSPAPLRVALKKGEEKPVSFSLIRAVAYLEVEGAVAGAQVLVDGLSMGEIDRNGAFRHEVPGGQHKIELTKDDYVPVNFTELFSVDKTTRLKGARVVMAKSIKVAPPAIPDPRQIEAQAWAQLANSTNPEDFDVFIRNHPGGSHLDQARARAGELRQQALTNKARQLDQSAWEKVDPNSREQLQDYLSRFPSGLHAQESRAMLAELSRASAEAVAAQRLREQKEQEQSARISDEQAIVRVLKDFEGAYNRKDIASLQRLWEGVPVGTYRQQFKEATNLSFQLRIQGPPSVHGNEAVAICTRSLSYKGQNGRPQTHTERVRVSLSRSASAWVIRSLDVY
jgi:serine/threonine protein kinase